MREFRKAFWTSAGTLFGYALVRVLTGHGDDAMFATAAGGACLLIYSVLYVLGPSKEHSEQE